MNKEKTWTIGQLLDWTTNYFKKYAIENPHLEAEILLAHVLAVPRINLYINYHNLLKPAQLSEFKKLILRRAKREPLPYITGTKWFMSLELEVTPDVLIPRPETEKLVEVVIDLSKSNPELRTMADIGTGSGAIAVSLAKYLPRVTVYATDISEKALEVAKRNASKHKVADRINFLLGDLLTPLKTKVDLIVSNPPYVKSEEIQRLQPEIKNYEPKESLEGGTQGLDYYKRIISQAGEYLKVKGWLVFEVGGKQAFRVSSLIREKRIFGEPKVIKDYAGIERVVVAQNISSFL